MGTLCGECAHLSEHFSKHFLELEVIHMKLRSSLKSIQERMLSVEKKNREELDAFQMKMFRQPETFLHLGTVKRLRKKVVERCYREVPQVVLERIRANLDSRKSRSAKEEVGTNSSILVGNAHGDFESGPKINPGVNMMECDICHLQVPDLSTHLYNDHFEEEGTIVKMEEGQIDNLKDDNDNQAYARGDPLQIAEDGTQDHSHQENCHIKDQLYPIPVSSPGLSSNEYNSRFGAPIVHEIIFPVPTKEETDQSSPAVDHLTAQTEDDGNFSCKFCWRKLTSRKGLRLHYMRAHDSWETAMEPQHKCDICQKRFNTVNGLNMHKESLHFGTRYPCNYCSRSFTQPSSRNLHMKRSCCKKPE